MVCLVYNLSNEQMISSFKVMLKVIKNTREKSMNFNQQQSPRRRFLKGQQGQQL